MAALLEWRNRLRSLRDIRQSLLGWRTAPPAPPEPPLPPIHYLVSTAGHPNYGDELITRAWLDLLTEMRPDAEVWLDCPHPGRASHLFRHTHPRLHFTNTLWELAHSSPSHDPIVDSARITRQIRDLGTPRIDLGLFALREATSVHLIGGGHFNDLWQDNLGIVAAVAALRREFGVTAWATGLGLQPLRPERSAWLCEQFTEFDHVDVRDRASADAIGVEIGLDDAFLALSGPRPVYDEEPSADNIVLVQGDLRAWSDTEAISTIDAFLKNVSDEECAFVEALPPDDARYVAGTRPRARFYSFGNIWFDGFPARAGQRWLTTRFHAHLLAAAAGASGTVIAGQEGYYDHKHASLLELGTGWTTVPAGSVAEPAVNPDFPARAREYAAAKRHQAEMLYAAHAPLE